MTSNELHSREILIEFLMFELKISRKESQSQLAELEKFGLIEIKPKKRYDIYNLMKLNY